MSESLESMDFSSMLEGIKSGNIPLTNTATPIESTPEPSTESSTDFDPIEYLKGDSGDNSDADGDGRADVSDNSTNELSSESVREISIGPKGRKRTVKVDFSDIDKLETYVRKAHDFQAGMRKFQQERDQSKTELTQAQQQIAELQQDFERLDKLVESDPRALFQRLLGSEDRLQKFIDQEIQRREEWELMDPEDRYKVERDKWQTAASEREKQLQAKLDELASKVQQDKSQSELNSVKAMASAAISKHGFDGQLGNQDSEHLFNETLWKKVMSNLDHLPEDTEVTQAIIDREFRNVSKVLKQSLKLQTKAKTKEAMDKATEKAMSKAKAVASRGHRNKTVEEEFKQNIRSGNLTDAVKAFMTGKVRL